MAYGKSFIGKLLALALNRTFIDTDKEIEIRSGFTVEQIFALQGEAAFRKMEKDILLEISTRSESWVVATGGGMPVIDEAMEIMKRSGKVVFIKRSLRQILSLLRKDYSRPLAINTGKKELYFKYKDRLNTYRQAHYVVKNRNARAVLDKIIQQLE